MQAGSVCSVARLRCFLLCSFRLIVFRCNIVHFDTAKMKTALVLALLIVCISSKRDRFGNEDSDSRRGGDRSSTNLRVDVKVRKFSNPDGVRMDGKGCDWLSKCDTWIHAYIDFENPDAPFPDRSIARKWPKIGEKWDDNNSPVIPETQGTIVRDLCGDQYRGANLRVWVGDWDGMGVREEINNFDCKITRQPDSSADAAQWRQDVTCVPVYKGHPMTLEITYRIYSIPRSQCEPQRMTTRSNRR